MLEELYDAANDPHNKVDKDMVRLLEAAWDDAWEAIARGLRR